MRRLATLADVRPRKRARRTATIADVQASATERQIQRGIVDAIGLAFPRADVRHVPNGAKMHKAEAAKMKADGMKAGTLDLFVMWSGGCAWLEVKRPKYRPSAVSDEQVEFIALARAAGLFVEIVTSIDAALAALDRAGCPRGHGE